MEVALDILKDNNLRNTGSRKAVLSVFLENKIALTQADIEERVDRGYDRVTIYRTLKTFVINGILHKVLDDEGTAKYALCNDSCSNDNHNHEHVHFKCEVCNTTTCLNHVEVPIVRLPSGYTFKEANLLVQGVCKNCS